MKNIKTGVIDAKPIGQRIRADIEKNLEIRGKRGYLPEIAIVRVGRDPASEFYFNAKIKRAKEFGIEVIATTLEEDAREKEVLECLKGLSNDRGIHGILLESPVPGHLDYKKLVNTIPFQKDIDGATDISLGRLMSGEETLVAATPLAVMEFLGEISLESGSLVSIINRTITVGKPLTMLLLNANYTPVVCHSRTKNLKEICRRSDAIVVAAGRPGFLGPEYVNNNSVVVDVGINSENGKIVGDADFESLKGIVKTITPVPGGVGSITSLIIFKNLIQAQDLQEKF